MDETVDVIEVAVVHHHPRTASGSATTSLLRSVFATSEDIPATTSRSAAPRSGPAWFGSVTDKAAKAAAAQQRRGPGMLKSPAELGRTATEEDADDAKKKDASAMESANQASTTSINPALANQTVQASETVIGMRQRKQVLQQQIAAAWRQEETNAL